MKTEEHNKLINGIKEKLGEEETSKIADDLALLISDNTQVNNELKNVNFVLHDILDLLDKGGIISVISFHSLEDRIVKQIFKFESQKCRCNEMICKCPPPRIELVNRKPIMACEKEIMENPPSRSAKLRVVRAI